MKLTIDLEYGNQHFGKSYITELDKMMRFVKSTLPKILWIKLYTLKYNKKPTDKEIKTMCIDY